MTSATAPAPTPTPITAAPAVPVTAKIRRLVVFTGGCAATGTC
jgi:hypothetical protein